MDYKEISELFEDIFLKKKEIVVVYLYGSFVKSDIFNDIDIGVLVKEEYRPEILYEAKLAQQLENKLKGKIKKYENIDVRVLNGKPLRFLFSILKKSKLIFSNNEIKRIRFEAKVMKEYLDLKPHHEQYDKMRELRYELR